MTLCFGSIFLLGCAIPLAQEAEPKPTAETVVAKEVPVEAEAELPYPEQAVLVFSASWCGPCHRAWNLVETLVKARPEWDNTFFKVDIDVRKDLVKEYNMEDVAIPCFIYVEYEKGKYIEKKRHVGAPKDWDELVKTYWTPEDEQ